MSRFTPHIALLVVQLLLISYSARAQRDSRPVVRARAFELVDDSGKVRAELSIRKGASTDYVYLRFRDSKDEETVMVESGNGHSSLTLGAFPGNGQISLVSNDPRGERARFLMGGGPKGGHLEIEAGRAMTGMMGQSGDGTSHFQIHAFNNKEFGGSSPQLVFEKHPDALFLTPKGALHRQKEGPHRETRWPAKE